MQLDPSVGIVVITFHNAAGATGISYPSERQLQTYRDQHQTEPARPIDPAAPSQSGKPPSIA
jgi:hypothetical protein